LPEGNPSEELTDARPVHLYVPTIGLVVAGGAAYNGVHQLLAETDSQKRREWIGVLDKVESLKPRTVIAGHKRPGNEDHPALSRRLGSTFATSTD
jgi:hypothetical protein